jgi:hypothetical protein
MVVVAISLTAWLALLALVAALCRTARLGDRQLGAAHNGRRGQASSAATAEQAESYSGPVPARARAPMQAGPVREAPWGEPKAA